MPNHRSALTRRRVLEVGSLGLFGLGLADVLRGAKLTAAEGPARKPRAAGFGSAKSCIVVFLKGGPPQQDTFDPKPDAPREVRGEFRPIPTAAPGIHLSEHLPLLAKQARKFSLLHTLSHKDGTHSTAAFLMTTGRPFPRPGEAIFSRDDPPHVGSIVAAVEREGGAVPPFAMVPEQLVVNGELRGGQGAGLLGTRFDPLVPGGDPNLPGYRPAVFADQADVDAGLLRARRGLLESLDHAWRDAHREPGVAALDSAQAKAFALLERGLGGAAFDLAAERQETRDRYGRTTLGQSALLARRLVEAGARLVHVNCMSSVKDPMRNWDLHKDNFNTLKDVLLPRTDAAVAALIEDLHDRGLLDETLVLVLGEFGRSPQINKDAGRDHWPQAQSVLVAGAGIPGGTVYGATDAQGAYPIDRPVTPQDLCATVLHALGVDPARELRSADGRPFRACEGEPIAGLWG